MAFESDSIRPDCGSNLIKLVVRRSTARTRASLVQRCSQCDRVLSVGAKRQCAKLGDECPACGSNHSASIRAVPDLRLAAASSRPSDPSRPKNTGSDLDLSMMLSSFDEVPIPGRGTI